jgi:hypothetical protein
MVFSLVYTSSATQPFSVAQLSELLELSRHNNSTRDVTGMLVYNGGNFMQLLEGEEHTVRSLFEKIARDPRHTGSMILLTTQELERSFPDWSMAFRDMNDPAVKTLPGFNTFLSSPQTGRNPFTDATRAQKLLMYFKQSMR